MTGRATTLVAVVQLAVFFLWLLGEMTLVSDPMALSAHAARGLLLGQVLFCWVAPLGSGIRTSLAIGVTLLFLPLPAYVLLYLTGGLSTVVLAAVPPIVAAALAGAILMHRVGERLPGREFRRAGAAALRLLPVLWIWSARDQWLAWMAPS